MAIALVNGISTLSKTTLIINKNGNQLRKGMESIMKVAVEVNSNESYLGKDIREIWISRHENHDNIHFKAESNYWTGGFVLGSDTVNETKEIYR